MNARSPGSQPRKKSGQHYVPACYLRQFVDPSRDPRHDPYVWIFDKGARRGKKKSPENILKSTDIYTLKGSGVTDKYAVEEELNRLETRYAALFRRKISKHLPLTFEEHRVLCAFVYAMFHRTIKTKSLVEGHFDSILDHISALEAHHLKGGTSKTGDEMRAARADIHKLSLVQLIPRMARFLGEMDLAFLCAPSVGARYITSDNPCFMWNSRLQWQRGTPVGLGQQGTEMIIPLSPTIAALFNHGEVRGYVRVSSRQVEDTNRLVMAHLENHFISNTERVSRYWFSPIPLHPVFFIQFLMNRGPFELLKQFWNWK